MSHVATLVNRVTGRKTLLGLDIHADGSLSVPMKDYRNALRRIAGERMPVASTLSFLVTFPSGRSQPAPVSEFEG